MSDLIEVVNQDTLVVEDQITSTIEIVDDGIVTISEESISLISESVQGPQGIPGESGAKGNISIGPDAPTIAAGDTGMWVQTGLGASGHDVTFWIEDGK